MRQINPIDHGPIVASVEKTGRLVAIDGSWANCGLSAEIIAGAASLVSNQAWKNRPSRVTLIEAPAPAARTLEDAYYPTAEDVVMAVRKQFL